MLGQNLLEEGDHPIPLFFGDVQVGMGFFHIASVILAWATRRFTHHGGYMVLQIRRWHALSGGINRRILVEYGIRHQYVDEITNHDRNRRKTTQPLVERRFFLFLIVLGERRLARGQHQRNENGSDTRLLRQMAKNRLRGERDNHTLNTTALVHEAYLKLVKFDRINWKDRSHFFAIASRIMRNVLVDYAVKQKAEKRGGNQSRIDLGEADAVTEVERSSVLSIHQALERLSDVDERLVRVVECRFFGGLSIDETARVLGVSTATVSRDWNMARAWLNREFADPENGKDG